MVLVVEDELLIQLVAIELFEDDGIPVWSASTGEEALAVLQTHCDEIDVLFTDVNLGPGISGFEVARRARALCPQIRVIYVSGAPQPDLQAERVSESLLFEKPYGIFRMLDVVRNGVGVDQEPPPSFGPKAANLSHC
jgi:CheY-like chemotaxis protein